MQFDLTHSMRTHIEKQTGIKTVWIYDGVSLPTTRPLVSVEQMQNNNTRISKERRTRTTYRFQVGLYAATIRDRSILQDKVKSALRERIEILSATMSGEKLGFLYADILAETPISPDDVNDKSRYHRVYFDVEIDVTL